MSHQVLDRTLKAFRIGDINGAYPIFDATGSTIAPGRWNTPAAPMIYSAANFSTALLEKLVYGSGDIPPNQHYIEITIPAGSSYEILSEPSLAGWDRTPATVSKMHGELWFSQKRSLILIVPSVIARIENNILINPAHPEFSRIEVSLHKPVHWDQRLFDGPAK